jgi:hypothetical protein
VSPKHRQTSQEQQEVRAKKTEKCKSHVICLSDYFMTLCEVVGYPTQLNMPHEMVCILRACAVVM